MVVSLLGDCPEGDVVGVGRVGHVDDGEPVTDVAGPRRRHEGVPAAGVKKLRCVPVAPVRQLTHLFRRGGVRGEVPKGGAFGERAVLDAPAGHRLLQTGNEEAVRCLHLDRPRADQGPPRCGTTPAQRDR